MPESESSRTWPEWDRMTERTEVALAVANQKITIVARAQDAEVGRLEGTISGGVVTLATVFVHPTITLKSKKGFFPKPATVPGRSRGYGTMLVRGLVAYARRAGISSIVGVVSAADLEENRYLLEWYSRRGFITERGPVAGVPGSGAALRMIV